jgi:hypothetical protein
MQPDRLFDETAWERAKRDAGGVFHSAQFALGTLLLDAIAAAIAVVVSSGSDTPAGRLIGVAVLAIVGGTAVAFLCVLVVQFASAPIKQRNELRHAHRVLLINQERVDPAIAEREERKRTQERVDRSQLLGAVGNIVEELEQIKGILEDRSSRRYFEEQTLPTQYWHAGGHVLTEQGWLSEHASARRAYRLIGEVNRGIDREYDNETGDMIAVSIDEAKATEALERIEVAVADLENRESQLVAQADL